MKAPRCGWREFWARIEDRWYHVPASRRRELIARVRLKVAAHLEPGHERIRDFDQITARTIRPSSLIHMARVHKVRGAWRWRDWFRSVRREDAATIAHMAATWVTVHRVPCAAWAMLAIGLALTWSQRAASQAVIYCPQTLALALAHEGQTPIAVNSPRCGWARVQWWRLRGPSIARAPESAIDLAPYVALAAVLLSIVYPDPIHAGVTVAALGATGVFEVRTGGNAANSGYFNPGGASPGTDRSQQTAPHVTIDGATITATVHTTTTQLNIVGHTVTSADNRNGVRITGGTMTAGLYEITGIDAVNNRWTIDRSGGTAGQTGTGRMGGAASSLGLVGGSSLVGRQKIWIDDGTYTISSATDNIDGGTFDNAVVVYIEGYQTSRGDLGTAPLLQASGISTFIVIEADGSLANVYNVSIDCASLTSGRGLELQSAGTAYKVTVTGATNQGINMASSNAIYCLVTGCTTQVSFRHDGGQITHCAVSDGTVTAFQCPTSGNLSTAAFCIADSNSGASSDGFEYSGTSKLVMHCVAYNNGRDGFRTTGTNAVCFMSCIAESNTGIGFNVIAAALDKVLIHNAAFGNGTNQNALADTLIVGATIIGASSFFTNAAAGDFSLNDTAGAGGDLRNAGFNSLNGTTASYSDIGAAQTGEGGPGCNPGVQCGGAHVGM